MSENGQKCFVQPSNVHSTQILVEIYNQCGEKNSQLIKKERKKERKKESKAEKGQYIRRVGSDGSAVDFGLEDPEFEPRWIQ